jgi:hypothetical protein
LTGLQVGLLEGALFNPADILKISTTLSRYRYGWGETSGNALRGPYSNSTVVHVTIRVLFSGTKIKRENLWLVVGCKYTNQRFSLFILVPEKRTLVTIIENFH